VIRMLEDELKINAPTQIIRSMGLPAQDPQQADRSVELFTKEGISHFKNR